MARIVGFLEIGFLRWTLGNEQALCLALQNLKKPLRTLNVNVDDQTFTGLQLRHEAVEDAKELR